MTRLDRFLAYSESRRLTVCVIAGVLTAGIAWADAQLPDTSIGFLYLFPVLVAAPIEVTLEMSSGALDDVFRSAFPLESLPPRERVDALVLRPEIERCALGHPEPVPVPPFEEPDDMGRTAAAAI